MPFEPRKPHHPSEAPLSEEFASPDLELLAEQLRQDASRLAARYPAKAWTADSNPPRKASLPVWTLPPGRRAALSLSAIAAALVVSTAAIWTASETTGIAESTTEQAEQAMRRPRLELHKDRLALEQPSGPALPPDVETQIVPASLFLDLTGPEKEALLDLFEDQSLAQASLSI